MTRPKRIEMTVIVTDNGFAKETLPAMFFAIDDLPANDAVVAINLPSDTKPEELSDRVMRAQTIRVDFPSFADGRGFTLARLLRARGFAGRLRAAGHVIADQYAMARRAGFDEVEIDDDLARRQPESQWRARADWQSHDYQNRLRG